MHVRPTAFFDVALIFALCLITLSLSSSAACTTLTTALYGRADAIGLVYDKSLPQRIVDDAIELWQSCRNYASGFPSFVKGHEGSTRTVWIQYARRSFSGRKCGAFKGNVITLYGFALDENGRRFPCGPLEQNLAHELGHVLGLSDAPKTPACIHHIMASVSHRNYGRRSVSAEECQVAGQHWITDAETSKLKQLGLGL